MSITNLGPKVRIVTSEKTWMEGEAIRQLEAVAKFEGMRECVGLPDMQPGKGSPSGAVFLSDRVQGELVGSDGGCGMSLYVTTLSAKRARPDQIADRLHGLDAPYKMDPEDREIWLTETVTEFDSSLGTPGHSNHFIEVQAVVEVLDQNEFSRIGMDRDALHVMVHSGSRGLGDSILREYATIHGADGVEADSEDGRHFLQQAAFAMEWAIANRQLCAYRVGRALRCEVKQLLDICHNSVTEAMVDGCRCWLHRKGAAPADKGPVIIPGSRGDLSYIVMPLTDGRETLWSLAHGAGRKVSRSDAKEKFESLYKGKDIRQNRWGGRLVCGDKALLYEEAPECYKPISTVIDAMEQAGLIKVVATLRPVVTFKTSEGVEQELRRDRRKWQTERSAAREVKRRN